MISSWLGSTLRVCRKAWSYALVLTIASAASSAVAVAQSTVFDAASIRAELARRGLGEADVLRRLELNGIRVAELDPAGLLAARERILAIVDSMSTERSSRSASVGLGESEVRTQSRDSLTSLEARRRFRATPQDSLAVFGRSIFTDQTVELFSTTDGARAPKQYILGVGDRLHVSIFGVSQVDLALEVQGDGSVQPAGVPRVFVRGLSLEAARRLLTNRLRAYYRFGDDQIVVSLAEARSITVSVLGETQLRGGFALSALNSALNALVAAGGPSQIGSLRRIRIVRGAEVRQLDVYRLLTNPEDLRDYSLEQGDMIVVPPAGPVVRVAGAVRRPMRYELVEGEGARDLIGYAGGVLFDAYSQFLQIERVENDRVLLVEHSLADVLGGRVAVPLRDGDVVRVRSVSRPLEAYASVNGAVDYPGRFDLRRSRYLADLLREGGLRPDAADFVFVVRRDSANRALVQHVRVATADAAAFPLQREDSVVVFERRLFDEVGELAIEGAVRSRVRTVFDPSLTVRSMIELAGGTTLRASLDRIDVFRARIDPERGVTFDRTAIRVDSSFRVVEPADGFQLRPFDRIFVRQIPLFSVERDVFLDGQVLYPGRYSLRNETVYLSDIVAEAGGLTDLANADAAYLLRSQGEVGAVGIDLRAALRKPRDAAVDPILVEGDSVVVPRRENTVVIRLLGTRVGEAKAQGLVINSLVDSIGQQGFIYQGSRSARWYIEQFAGGFASNADRRSVTVTDPSGRARGTRRVAFFFRKYPSVTPGSTIAVALKPAEVAGEREKFDWDQAIGRTTQALTALLTLLVLGRQL